MKKVVIILVIAIILAAGGYFAWRYLLQPRAGGPGFPLSEMAGPAAPAAADGGLRVLSDQQVFDYWQSSNGDIYYLTTSGEIFKIVGGQKQVMSRQTINNLSWVKPSPGGSLVIVAFGYPFRSTLTIFSVTDKNWLPLPDGASSAAWDPRSANRLVYIKNNGLVSSLNLFTINDRKSKELTKLNQKDLELDWVSADKIYLVERGSSQIESSVWVFDITTKIIKSLINGERGLALRWFNGKLGLKLSDNQTKVIDDKNNLLAEINLITLPEKCAYDHNRGDWYCAALNPLILNKGFKLSLPDDYWKKRIYFQDDIYRISPNGLRFAIFDSIISDKKVDAEHLEVHGNNIFFINRYDQKLYSLSL